MNAEFWNEIYVGGVLLSDVASGDVSALAAEIQSKIGSGGGWFSFCTSGETHYELHVTLNTDVVVRYRD